MATALLGELAGLPGLELVVTRDRRLPPPPAGVEVLPVGPGESLTDRLRRALPRCDLFWPLAPEQEGALERLVRLGAESGVVTIACSPESIALTGDKLVCCGHLQRAGIPVPETRLLDDPAGPPATAGGWVVKPRDGAGCEQTWFVPETGDPAVLPIDEPGGFVIQPWIEGEPLSLSLLVDERGAELLSVNRQRIGRREGRVLNQGVEVACRDPDAGLAALAGRVVAAIGGLRGYVGIDLQLTPAGPVVIELNPRLTSSYPGLGPLLGRNIAAEVISSLVPGVYHETMVAVTDSEGGQGVG